MICLAVERLEKLVRQTEKRCERGDFGGGGEVIKIQARLFWIQRLPQQIFQLIQAFAGE